MNDASLYSQSPTTTLGTMPVLAKDVPAIPPSSDNISEPTHAPTGCAQSDSLHHGRVLLNRTALRALRQGRLLSQQDLADDCWRRNIRVSIATIKRAESGRAVRYRIARELARCFDVQAAALIQRQ